MIWAWVVVIGFFAGMIGGLLGVGGGLVLVPLFHYVLKMNMHAAIATSLAVIVPTALFATLPNAFSGNVQWRTFMFAAIFSIIGSYIGAKISMNIDVALLKKIFAVFLILVAVRMFIK